jgi:hypothetical protein
VDLVVTDLKMPGKDGLSCWPPCARRQSAGYRTDRARLDHKAFGDQARAFIPGQAVRKRRQTMLRFLRMARLIEETRLSRAVATLQFRSLVGSSEAREGSRDGQQLAAVPRY